MLPVTFLHIYISNFILSICSLSIVVVLPIHMYTHYFRCISLSICLRYFKCFPYSYVLRCFRCATYSNLQPLFYVLTPYPYVPAILVVLSIHMYPRYFRCSPYPYVSVNLGVLPILMYPHYLCVLPIIMSPLFKVYFLFI